VGRLGAGSSFPVSSERLDADLAYVRDMGMNTIRLEGRLDRDEFFEKTDQLGILVMPGWTAAMPGSAGKIGMAIRTELRPLRCVTRSPGCGIIRAFCVAERQRQSAACRR